MYTRRRAAFTTAELLISLTILSIIGLSVAGVSVTLSNAHADQLDAADARQTVYITLTRLRDTLTKAPLVTFCQDDAVAYWREDANGDGEINLSELEGVRQDPRTGSLVRHRVDLSDIQDSGVREMLDESVPLQTATTVSGLAGKLINNPRSVTEVLSDDVTNFEVTASPASPRSNLVHLKLTVARGGATFSLTGAAKLRAGRADDVVVVDDEYRIETPMYMNAGDGGSPGGVGPGRGDDGWEEDDDEDEEDDEEEDDEEDEEEEDDGPPGNGRGRGRGRGRG